VNLEFSVFLECRSLENSRLRASQLKAVTGGSVNQRKLSPSPLPNPTKRQVLINAIVLTGLANFRVVGNPSITGLRKVCPLSGPFQ
jgi:hypothetical protein